ncbi:amino acid transport gap1 [Fusarium subglutinans]|uniref:Amino acid transport gap1 n=1 Tax=Gibberella subglutinans TaxID=42677 RepID=A0A8H5QA11_GIBSU|nr:amino acid transport gap1 [Fusarium subglutinans]KAF5610717.1 amino acid transport gap1 [Fusarium subglutinans]
MAFQSAQNKALIDLLKTGDYSDLTITCGKDQYRVHKAIICPRSKFFKAACDGKFKEAQTGTINLPDDDPVAVRMMIEYLYHDAYAPSARMYIHSDGLIDAYLSETEYNDEHEKSKMELYGAIFVGNKRVKRLTALPEVSIVPISHPLPFPFGPAAAPPPPPAAASQESGRGRGQSRRGRGSFAGVGSAPAQNGFQGSPNQSSSTPSSFSLGSPAPAPTPPPPQQPSAPQRSIPAENLHLHAKVYALGEKYGIQPLKALALCKFKSEAQFHLHSDDFLHAMREAYSSTIETDRPLRDAVVAILRSNKHLLKKDSVKEVLKDTGLGLSFDLVMEMASE